MFYYLFGRADRYHGGGFREAVPFEDLDVDVLEEVEHFHGGGGSANERHLEVAAESISDLAQHHLWPQRVRQ